MVNLHKRGKEFFNDILKKDIEKSSIIFPNGLVIGKIWPIYREDGFNDKTFSPDNEIIIQFNLYEILNFFENTKDLAKQFKRKKIEVSLVAELEKNGISGAENDINEYRNRNKENSMINLPIFIKNERNEQKEFLFEKNIELNLISTTKYREYC